MPEQMTTDVRTLLDRTPFDASTVADLREALGRDPSRYRTLREAMSNIRDRAKGKLDADSHLRLGVAAVLQGHFTSALDHLGKAGDHGLVHYFRGLALENLERWPDAAKAFEAASKGGFDPKNSELHRAGVLRRSGDLSGAQAALEKLKGLAGSSAEYHAQRGALLAAGSEQVAASEEFEKALAIEKGHTGALFSLAYINDLHGNDAAAVDFYKQCLQRPPVPLAALINLGLLYEDEMLFKKAEECYNQVLAAHPTHPRARLFAKDCRASRDMYYDEDIEKIHERLRQLLEIPVTDFELSVRSRNCLRKMNIRTLGDMTRITEAALLASKNFGETSLSEIKDMMTSKGLRLGMALEAGERALPEMGGPQEREPEISPEERAMLAKPITDLSLSVRARKCMTKLGISTVGDLIMRTGDELLECKNFGVTSLNEVRERLDEMGLKLKNE